MVKKLFSLLLVVGFANVEATQVQQVTKQAAVSVVAESKGILTRTKDLFVNSAAMLRDYIASMYNFAAYEHPYATATVAATLTFALLYTYNEAFRAKVRSMLGLEEEAKCRFCPEATSAA